MSNDPDAPGRQEPGWGQQPQSGPPSPYGQYGQSPQPAPWGPYGPPPQQTSPPASWGQYGQQPQYGRYGPYGGAPGGFDPALPPARPGAVITAAVLAFVYAALGVLVALGLFAGGAFLDDLVDASLAADPSLGSDVGAEEVGTLRGIIVLMGVLALAWTVVMAWGGALALRGRSRVLLLVGASISVAATGFLLLSAVLTAAAGEPGMAGPLVFSLVLFLGALAVLVLLCLRPAADYFDAHRARRQARR
ncbi:hypothetical protein [Modestobacter roseus]|uniref:Uncharacterized protein n=1 Tax=Modestobacter roseus TaxID=1181884 RepID=A0A562ISN4_9ACTN|nr:hypothetical protein [Modestobacter roseus]MQA33873.1 hypothetical protein [Modestobacter roseus]TWH73958.1 hypothetical protein JD78_02490 [Modestobacter roseus]